MTFRRVMQSIRLKLLVAVLGTTGIALLVAGSALLIIDVQDYRGVAMRDMQTQLALIGRASAPALQFDDPQVAAENLSLLGIRQGYQAAAIYDARGRLFASYLRRGQAGDLPRFPGNEGVWVDADGMYAFHRIIVDDEIAGTIYARTDYTLSDRVLKGVGIIGLIILLALAVAVLVSSWFQGFLIRPLLSISTTAREVVTRRDFSLRAEKMSDDEVGELADAFNRMLAEIEARAGELEQSNEELQREVAERRRVETEVMRLNRELDVRVRRRTRELEQALGELETFAYSVSHDLRAPLRSIDGYGEALAEAMGEALDPEAARYLEKIRSATRRLAQMIEELLRLSRLSRTEMHLETVDLTALARQVIDEHRQRDPDREVKTAVWHGMTVRGDPQLVRVMLENLIANAWKFTARTPDATIDIGQIVEGERSVYFVRDNGAGFDMAHADKLFGVFQRLHGQTEFPGTGIGLATVQRIVRRHGGRIWARAEPGRGAAFFFTFAPEAGTGNGPASGPRTAARKGGEPPAVKDRNDP